MTIRNRSREMLRRDVSPLRLSGVTRPMSLKGSCTIGIGRRPPPCPVPTLRPFGVRWRHNCISLLLRRETVLIETSAVYVLLKTEWKRKSSSGRWRLCNSSSQCCLYQRILSHSNPVDSVTSFVVMSSCDLNIEIELLPNTIAERHRYAKPLRQ
jgi:hypothetical protein